MDLPYTAAPPLEEELAWLRDPQRAYQRKPSLRGTGRDTRHRELALRRAAALDRLALDSPTPDAPPAAEDSAERLWIIDGWDENWEGRSLRDYVRWAYGQWLSR